LINQEGIKMVNGIIDYTKFTNGAKKSIDYDKLNKLKSFYGSLFYQNCANIFFNAAISDPLNHEYVYIIHCIKGRTNDYPGYHIFCYYMENRYRYFFDVAEGDARVSLIYDPGVIDVKLNDEKNRKKD
jgi:hypothetical protein